MVLLIHYVCMGQRGNHDRNNTKLVCHDLIFPILFGQCDLTSDNVSKASTAGLRNEKKKPGFSWEKL